MRRRCQRVAPVLLGLLALLTGCGAPGSAPVGPPAPTPSRAAPTTVAAARCPDVQILGLRGQGQSSDDAAGVGQEVLGVAEVVEAGLADRGLRTELVAVRHPARSGSDADYTADLRHGVRMTTAKIRAVAQRCPESAVVLIGFSMGAQVVHLTAVELAPRWRSHLGGLGLLGDPLRDPDATVVQLALGTGEADGTGSNGPGRGFGPLSDHVVSACVVDDNVCNVGPGGRVGGISEAHRHAYETREAAGEIGRALAAALR